jgi:hypothetical protein
MDMHFCDSRNEFHGVYVPESKLDKIVDLNISMCRHGMVRRLHETIEHPAYGSLDSVLTKFENMSEREWIRQMKEAGFTYLQMMGILWSYSTCLKGNV